MNPLMPVPGTETEAPTIIQVILLPGIFFAIGVIIWIVAFMRERDGGNRKIKWFAYIPLLISMLMAYEPFFRTFGDQAYVEDVLLDSRRLIYMGIYPAFLLPVVAAVAFAIWHVYDRKMSRYR